MLNRCKIYRNNLHLLYPIILMIRALQKYMLSLVLITVMIKRNVQILLSYVRPHLLYLIANDTLMGRELLFLQILNSYEMRMALGL
jgi:hypothetical protein